MQFLEQINESSQRAQTSAKLNPVRMRSQIRMTSKIQ